MELAEFRWYPASTARRFRLRRKKNSPPATAPTAAIPTTTPAAIPAVLGPLAFFSGAAGDGTAFVWPGAVTTMVLARVMVDGGSCLVGSGSFCAAATGEGLLFAAGVEVDDGIAGSAAALGSEPESSFEPEPAFGLDPEFESESVPEPEPELESES